MESFAELNGLVSDEGFQRSLRELAVQTGKEVGTLLKDSAPALVQ